MAILRTRETEVCGILGIYGSDAAAVVNPGLVQAMTDIIAHRGPESSGAFLDGNVGLGVRRLSIIDPVSDDQPISNEDGTCHIAFNGEIYSWGSRQSQGAGGGASVESSQQGGSS